MTDKDYLVHKLLSGPEIWNQWRAEHPQPAKLDLTQVNLSGANLAGVDLSEADLTEANLSGADLSKAKLYVSNLSGANFKSANLSQSKLNGAILTRADLSGASLIMADLRSIPILEHDRLYELFRSQYEPILEAMHRHKQSTTNLTGANLHSCDLRLAQLQNVTFIQANLTDALLNQSNLFYADFEGADLSGADFRKAFLHYIKLLNTIIPRTTKINERWRRLSLLLSDKVKKPYHWWGAQLQYTDLGRADLSEVIMPYANLRGANLREANLMGANLENAQIAGAIWQRAKYNLQTILPDLTTLQKQILILVDPPLEPDKEEVLINLEELKDERKRTNVFRVSRDDQQKFRTMLKDAFQGKCAITSCDIEQAIEAAHIFPYRGPETDCLWNGILLRLDFHRLFDSYLLTLDALSYQVRLGPSLMNSCYRKYADTKVCFPEQPVSLNRQKALQWHNAQCSWFA